MVDTVSCLNYYLVGFEKPSAIQQRAIKQIVVGRDVIAQYVRVYIYYC